MQNNESLKVYAFWDEEAEVWVASSDDVPGLATEAASLDELKEKLLVLVPELIDLNDNTPFDHTDVPISLLSECRFTAAHA